MPQHDTTTEHAATGALADDTPSTPRQERETTTVSAALATDKPLGFKIQGENTGDVGRIVSAAGDVNGDGIDDVIIAAGSRDDYSLGRGVYVVFGSPQGFAPVIDLAVVAQGEGGFEIQGENPRDQAGFSLVGAGVSAAGDINGDGVDDLIVGATLNDSGGTNAGAAYIVFGSDEGFPALVDLAAVAQGQGGFKVQGESPNDQAGGSVSAAGDVNSDGIDDFIVSAANDSGGFGAGAAYVVFGSSQGFAPLIDLAAVAQGQGGFKIQGQVLDIAGNWVSAAGDVNGDGIDDMIVGAYAQPGGSSDAGAAYVVFGTDRGFPALVDLATVAQGQGGFKIQGENASDRAGSSVSAAGDFNGDGIDDLIVGAPFNDGGGLDAGAAYVVFGSSQGFAPLIDLAAIAQGQGGFKVQGDPRRYVGDSVSAAGDINDDGIDDLIVGGSGGGLVAGAAYVIFGGQQLDATVSVSEVGTTISGFAIRGGGEALGIGSVSDAGDMDGDGFDDLIVGVFGNDSGGTNAGAAYVIYGRTDPFPAVIDLGDLGAPPTDLPSLSVADPVPVAEGDGEVVFTVTSSAPSTLPVTVTYSTLVGTANADGPQTDYNGVVDQTLTFQPGETEKLIPITLIADTTPEPDETFQLLLENPTNATLANDRATATIVDDDEGFPAEDDFPADTSTPGILAQGSPVSGNIESPGDVDWIKINVSGGDRHVFHLWGNGPEGTALANPKLEIILASGDLALVQSDAIRATGGGYGGNERLEWVPPLSGQATFYLRVSSEAADGIGSYQLAMWDKPAAFGTFPVAQDANQIVVTQGYQSGDVSHFGQFLKYSVDIDIPDFIPTNGPTRGDLQEIYSLEGGLVVSRIDDAQRDGDDATNGGGNGNQVTVLHDSGVFATYAHFMSLDDLAWAQENIDSSLSSIAVNIGERVTEGQLLGYGGGTGFVSGGAETKEHSHVAFGTAIQGFGRVDAINDVVPPAFFAEFFRGDQTYNFSPFVQPLDVFGTSGDDGRGSRNGLELWLEGSGRVFGGAGDDRLRGTDARNEIYGGTGNDRIEGRGGDDLIWGGAGEDVLTGGPVADTFVGSLADHNGDRITDFRPTTEANPLHS